MKRSTHEGSVVVYQYGTPHWADLDEEGMRQLRLAHDLWNELVAIERKYDEATGEAQRDVPELAEADRLIQEAAVRVTEIQERMKRERMRDRTTILRTATKEELQAARTVLRAAKERRKVVREEMQTTWRAIRTEANVAKQNETGPDMYRTWTERGLGWGTYNEVCDRIDTTRKQIIKRRTEGEPAEFHFHRWQGEGTLNVQCQQMAGKPRRVEWEIVGDHPKHKTLRLRVGRARSLGAYWLEVPFVYHRPLPVSPQDVSDVQVTRKVLAGKSRLTVTFSCRVPTAQPRRNGTSVAIRLGWKREQGDIRVAYVASSEPLPPVPEYLRPVVRMTGDRHANVVLPASYIWPLTRDEEIHSIRDRMLEELRPLVVAALENESIRDLIKGDPSRWRSQARFAALTKHIPATHPLYSVMETWRQRDKHLWLYETNERDQVIARRRDTWRKVAVWLATEAQVFAISGTDYSEIKRKPTETEDSYEQRGGRRQLQMAAPGELRLFIEQAAHKHGIQIMHVERGGSNADGADSDPNSSGRRAGGIDLETATGTGD